MENEPTTPSGMLDLDSLASETLRGVGEDGLQSVCDTHVARASD
jgi:hypothetical protein